VQKVQKEVRKVSKPEFARIYEIQEAMWRVENREQTGNEIKMIIEALRKDPSPIVRHEAAFALGEIASIEAVEALAHAVLHDHSPLVRHESAEALGWIPTEASRRALEEALNDSDADVVATARISLDMHNNPRVRK